MDLRSMMLGHFNAFRPENEVVLKTYDPNYIPFQRFIDAVFFPIRALFIPFNDRLGLTSMRNERFIRVAEHCRGNVLDIGCGRDNLFIRNYIGEENGMGIDVFPYQGVTRIVEDMTCLPFEDNSFDTVTLVAVGGHIPKHLRAAEFKEFSRVLTVNGRLIMTEGEPVTQTLNHVWRHYSLKVIGQQDMDSERGMEEDEEYCMPFEEIMTYLNTPPLKFEQRIKFMWRLNNIYIARKHSNR